MEKTSDPTAFRDRLVQFMPELKKIASLMTSDEDRTKDLVQDTLLKCLEYERLFTSNNFNGWVYTIMMNTLRNDWDKINVRKKVMLSYDGMEECSITRLFGQSSCLMECNIDYLAILSELDKLIDDDRFLMNCHIRGYSNIEISDLLHIPGGTVKSRLHHIKNKLRKRLSAFL